MVLKYLSLALVLAATVQFCLTVVAVVVPWWNTRITTYAAWMSTEFQAMFQEMSVERARRLITGTVAGCFAFGFLLASAPLARVLFGLVFAFAGYFGPWLAVWYMAKRRLSRMDDQLIEALQMMSNALRSSLSLPQALEMVVREMTPPIADEFGRVVKEIHLGRLLDDALKRFSERVPLDDLRLVVDSILTLRETGGDLSVTFEVIANTIVERKKVEGKIKAMTAQGMTQGVVICSMPIALMLIFTMIDPLYMRPFFTTPLGWIMILLIFVLDGMGLWLMFKLVRVDV